MVHYFMYHIDTKEVINMQSIATLAEHRKKAGFNTQEELSSALGVERGTVAKWEVGDRYPRPPMITKMAQILNITEGDIISAITSAKERNIS